MSVLCFRNTQYDFTCLATLPSHDPLLSLPCSMYVCSHCISWCWRCNHSLDSMNLELPPVIFGFSWGRRPPNPGVKRDSLETLEQYNLVAQQSFQLSSLRFRKKPSTIEQSECTQIPNETTRNSLVRLLYLQLRHRGLKWLPPPQAFQFAWSTNKRALLPWSKLNCELDKVKSEQALTICCILTSSATTTI